MRDISRLMNLSRPYTNHCLRATSLTVLGDKFEDTDVCTVSSHKSVSNLAIFKRTSLEKKWEMAECLMSKLDGGDKEVNIKESDVLKSSCLTSRM